MCMPLPLRGPLPASARSPAPCPISVAAEAGLSTPADGRALGQRAHAPGLMARSSAVPHRPNRPHAGGGRECTGAGQEQEGMTLVHEDTGQSWVVGFSALGKYGTICKPPIPIHPHAHAYSIGPSAKCQGGPMCRTVGTRGKTRGGREEGASTATQTGVGGASGRAGACGGA